MHAVFTQTLKMFRLEIEIPLGALSQIINVGLTRRRHREQVATDGLGFHAAAIPHHHHRRHWSSAGDHMRIDMNCKWAS